MKKILLTSLVLLSGLAINANAAIIFEDNFDSENGGVGALNYNSFANWSVNNGTVDLIGNGFFDFFPDNGLYVDLDGSTGDAGVMRNVQRGLTAGDYTLSFDLAGNQRNGATERTRATVNVVGIPGVEAVGTYSLPENTGFLNYVMNFSITDDVAPTRVAIRFLAAPVSGNPAGDNIGMLLDNIKLVKADVPEPAMMGLFGAGLIGLGFARRFRSKKS